MLLCVALLITKKELKQLFCKKNFFVNFSLLQFYQPGRRLILPPLHLMQHNAVGKIHLQFKIQFKHLKFDNAIVQKWIKWLLIEEAYSDRIVIICILLQCRCQLSIMRIYQMQTLPRIGYLCSL